MLILIAIITAACFSVFLHYCIGSPVQGEFYTGRIFSFYGRWVSEKYLNFEEKEHRRVWGNFEAWKKQQDAIFLDKDISQEEFERFLKVIDNEYNKVESKKKANPYSALGACPICFSTWVCIVTFIIFTIFALLPIWTIFICSPVSVVISRYIKLT